MFCINVFFDYHMCVWVCVCVYVLGKTLGFTFNNKNFHNVSLGQGQEVVAEQALDVAAKEGHWVILQVHARTHTCTHTQVHARTHMCTHARTHAHTEARRHTQTHARRHTPMHKHTSTHPCTLTLTFYSTAFNKGPTSTALSW